MIKKQYIAEFEKYGFGMFVHFGIYSLLGSGEWVKHMHAIPDGEYDKLRDRFDPDPDWAKELVRTAKSAGCRYITLTTRHHDGFSLYDTCGLNDFDAPHALCRRDLVREFVDACGEEGIVPFFYHTLLDWYNKDFENDFKAYLDYLRKSVKLLCTNYGRIGGIWFDGMWSRPAGTDWEEDALYSLIREYQPEAMIINNTGLDALGKLGNIELDSVTFERGKPFPINLEGSPKYIASEMCDALCDHWGYAEYDLDYKSPADIIRSLADCRRYGANLLLNVGPRADGSLRTLDKAYFETLGKWVSLFDEAIRSPRPSGIEVKGREGDFILRDGNKLYLFAFGLQTGGEKKRATFKAPLPVKSAKWMDTCDPISFSEREGEVTLELDPYIYGRDLVVRVALIGLSERIS